MSEPFRAGMVAVVGRPNAGKSTLVNRLVGEKVAIVSDKPQTTRRRVLGVVRRPEYQLVLVDTPGIHRPEHRMNAAMVRDAVDALSGCDAVVLVVDASEPRGAGERHIARLIGQSGRPAVAALNKIDRVRKPELLPMLAEVSTWAPFRELVPVSARDGTGLPELERALAALLPESPPLYPDGEGAPGPLAEKIAEQIREPALALTREELPFSLAVVVEELRTDEARATTYVRAALVVERESQKGILVGRGGKMIRDIGTAARMACEERFGGRFYLDLRVEARTRWREDEAFLSRIVNPDV